MLQHIAEKILPLTLIFVALSTGCYTKDQTPNTGEIRSLVWNMRALQTAEEAGKSVSETVWGWPSLNRWDLVFLQDDQYFSTELTVWLEYENWTKIEGVLIPTREALNIVSHYTLEPPVRQQWEDCNISQPDCKTTAGFTWSSMLLSPSHWVDVINVRLIDEEISNPAIRASNVAQLVDFVLRQSVEGAMIVAGDFALKQIGETAEDLQEVLDRTGLQDVCSVLNCGQDKQQRFLYRSSSTVSLEPTHWEVVADLPAADYSPPESNEPIEVWFAWETTDAITE